MILVDSLFVTQTVLYIGPNMAVFFRTLIAGTEVFHNYNMINT